MQKKQHQGFTLIELLVVMAIIGILALLIVPNVGGAIASAKKTKTVAFFKGLEGAFEQYYADYKTLPSSSALGNQVNANTTNFIEILTGMPRDLSASSASIGSVAKQENPRLTSFFSFDNSTILDDKGDPDYKSGKIVDAFGNVDIRMYFAANPAKPIFTTGPSGTVQASPSPGANAAGSAYKFASFPNNLSKRVIFYSAGRGRDKSDVVVSW